MESKGAIEIATLGGGCFWCLEPAFVQLVGVEQVVVGYSGGELPNPTYDQVCSGTTGHAEVARIHFDPQIISFRDILEVFFTIHDPTTLNRQGNDVGPQYRSAIFYHSDEQRRIAEEIIRELDDSGAWGSKIVTEVRPFSAFFKAEEYHQDYYAKNPGQGYCQVIIAPKLAKFREKYSQRLKDPIAP